MSSRREPVRRHLYGKVECVFSPSSPLFHPLTPIAYRLLLTAHRLSPIVYEVNTRCWLRELSAKAGRTITLDAVPQSELDQWRRLGFTHIWLMGVWPTARQSFIFSRHPAQLKHWRKLLPDLRIEDVAGSPYAIAGYDVPPDLGGEAGLAQFRGRLAAGGLKLLLDFVPNHTGLDHPWVAARPELFVHSLEKKPGTFRVSTARGPRWIAHGKDPFFPPWVDTAQLDYRNPAVHAAMADELASIARRCDGVRCDMAMLVLPDVFLRNWSSFSAASRPPSQSFWASAIPAIKKAHPDFLFMAEAYWDLETRLLELGFDYAYDKRVLDLLVARHPPELQRCLLTRPPGFLQRATHFLENHDEPRIASRLSFAEHRAAALVAMGLPGMRLLHEGQLEGAVARASVHLTRRPVEPPQAEIAAFYQRLLQTLQGTAVGRGRSELIEPRPAWAGNPTHQNFILVLWQSSPMQFDLVVVNLAPHSSQCYAPLSIKGLARHHWLLVDLLGGERHTRDGRELRHRGLYLDLPAHGAQLFRIGVVE